MSKSRVDHGNPLSRAPYGATMYQAQGMVTVQANCTMRRALETMKARARDDGLSVDEIARDVVARRIRFD